MSNRTMCSWHLRNFLEKRLRVQSWKDSSGHFGVVNPNLSFHGIAKNGVMFKSRFMKALETVEVRCQPRGSSYNAPFHERMFPFNCQMHTTSSWTTRVHLEMDDHVCHLVVDPFLRHQRPFKWHRTPRCRNCWPRDRLHYRPAAVSTVHMVEIRRGRWLLLCKPFLWTNTWPVPWNSLSSNHQNHGKDLSTLVAQHLAITIETKIPIFQAMFIQQVVSVNVCSGHCAGQSSSADTSEQFSNDRTAWASITHLYIYIYNYIYIYHIDMYINVRCLVLSFGIPSIFHQYSAEHSFHASFFLPRQPGTALMGM